MAAAGFQRLAEIEVDVVTPERNGFALMGKGSDQAEYTLEVHFDMPLDTQTRAVLGELLAQSELTISRRPPVVLPKARRDGAHRSRSRRITAD